MAGAGGVPGKGPKRETRWLGRQEPVMFPLGVSTKNAFEGVDLKNQGSKERNEKGGDSRCGSSGPKSECHA